MRQPTTLEERIQIHELAQAQHPAPDIAQQVKRAVSTVRKWRRRGREQGRAGLVSVLGRPVRGILSSYAPLIAETLRAWRTSHPGWGPQTLHAELELAAHLQGQRLPSPAQIACFLQAQGLTRRYARHSELPPVAHPRPQAAHEEWQMDARGHDRVPEVGLVTLIDLNDCFSRVRLLSYPCLLGRQRVERHATTADYQIALRLAFMDWGLPQRLAVDHESVFYDNDSPSPFPTRWHLWLLALGISVVFGHVARPTEQGLTEQSHQLWEHQVLRGPAFAAWESLYATLRQRRDFVNWHLPCASLGERPPLVAHPQALTPLRAYRPEWEANLLDLSRVYAYLAQGRWFRRVSTVGTLSLSGQVYSLGRAWAKQQVEITFDPADQQLHFFAPKGEPIKCLPLHGVSVETLMGELGPLTGLPAFQLALPFTWEGWRLIRLFQTLGITT